MVFDARNKEFGEQLMGLPTDQIMTEASVRWVDPVYECTFEFNKLKSIYHRRTRSTVNPGPDCTVTSAWSMDFPWSEIRACFVLPPYPAVP
eukprot:3157761-Prorocentrum_lima.AAC.1